MVAKRQSTKRKGPILDARRALAREKRSREIVARPLANKTLMDGLQEVLESRARGDKPVRFEDLKWKDA
jgi:hypothetical protein